MTKEIHVGRSSLPAKAEADVVFEAAWGGTAIAQAVQLARPGGRVVLVGIPADEQCAFSHTIARRKELSIIFCRRLKHTYPRAIQLVADGRVDVHRLITHRYPLARARQALHVAAGYRDGVVKAVVRQ